MINLQSQSCVLVKTERGSIIQISFSGDYPPGSAANDVARAMETAVTKALREFAPVAVIFDLSNLRYVWGDAICTIFMPLRKRTRDFDFLPSCVVAQGETRKALTRLMAPNCVPGIAKSMLFPEIEQALEHLIKRPS